MILETFLLNKMKTVEKFQDGNAQGLLGVGLFFFIIFLALIIFFTFGAVSLSWNYNNYLGTSFVPKLFYGFLVFLFPTFYYPFYAWFLNPIKNFRRNITPRGINQPY